MTHRFLISCPANCEDLLRKEVEEAGGQNIKTRVRSVVFDGDAEVGYRICLRSRIGNALIRILAEGHAETKAAIASLAETVPWESVFSQEQSFCVLCKTAVNNKTEVIHSHYGAQLLKDAVCDRFRRVKGGRPAVDTQNPDVRLHLRIVHAHVIIGVGWSGENLSRRGYRTAEVKAPLKENTAAAVAARCRKYWQTADFIVDPMCGSGTLLIETALAAFNAAAGLLRSRRARGFGFQALPDFDGPLWARLCAEEEENFRAAAAAASRVRFFGFDIDAHAAEAARKNAEASGFGGLISIRQADFRTLSSADFPADWRPEKTFLIVNPPYGERLGEKDSVAALYRDFGETLRRVFPGAAAGVLCGSAELSAAVGLKAEKTFSLRNGALETTAAIFPVFSAEKRTACESAASNRIRSVQSGETLSDGAKMFVNRLKKNEKEWKKSPFSKRTGAFRLYDADMPEYNAAIDVYIPAEGADLSPRIDLSEYAPPSSISEENRRRRLNEMIDALIFFFQVDHRHIYVKTRFKQKNGAAYGVRSRDAEIFTVNEEGLLFEVNLSDYLDTGLYSDHRPLRRIIRSEAAGKSFLNLFSYTATASVCAAAGGAGKIASVDTSSAYLKTGQRNFERNGFSSSAAAWIKSDVMTFLRKNRGKFDLVYADPPTFSNSKSLKEDFNLQRDHGELIRLCMERLTPGGVLYFSNHFRKFVLDDSVLRIFSPEEITESTVDPDFRRNPKIHRCWRFVKK